MGSWSTPTVTASPTSTRSTHFSTPPCVGVGGSRSFRKWVGRPGQRTTPQVTVKSPIRFPKNVRVIQGIRLPSSHFVGDQFSAQGLKSWALHSLHCVISKISARRLTSGAPHSLHFRVSPSSAPYRKSWALHSPRVGPLTNYCPLAIPAQAQKGFGLIFGHWLNCPNSRKAWLGGPNPRLVRTLKSSPPS